MFDMESGWAQSQGKREYQEDALAFYDEWPGAGVFILSDGMGGAVFGEVASQEIIESFFESFCTSKEEDVCTRLESALHTANKHLQEYIGKYPDYDGMGGTLIGAAIHDRELSWVSVGDSPLWLVRGGELHQLNADHSRKGEMKPLVEQGLMTEEELNTHPERNQLTSAVMGYEIAHVDVNAIDLQNGDMVVMASDGVETMSDQELLSVCTRFSHAESKTIAEHIVTYVDGMDKPYQDNTSVLIIKINEAT